MREIVGGQERVAATAASLSGPQPKPEPLDDDRLQKLIEFAAGQRTRELILAIFPDATEEQLSKNSYGSYAKVLMAHAAGENDSTIRELIDRLNRANPVTTKIDRLNLHMELVNRRLARSDLQGATSLVEEIEMASRYGGFRRIARHHAERGEVEEFDRVMKKCDRRKNKGRLHGLNALLVQAITLEDPELGLREAEKRSIDPRACLEVMLGQKPELELVVLADQLLPRHERFLFFMELLNYAAQKGRDLEPLLKHVETYVANHDPTLHASGTPWKERTLCVFGLGMFLLRIGRVDDAERVAAYLDKRNTSRKTLESDIAKARG